MGGGISPRNYRNLPLVNLGVEKLGLKHLGENELCDEDPLLDQTRLLTLIEIEKIMRFAATRKAKDRIYIKGLFGLLFLSLLRGCLAKFLLLRYDKKNLKSIKL